MLSWVDFALRAAGYNRRTMDVGLIVAVDPDNEARVFSALATLPDNAVRELQPGELQQYNVIRVADEVLVDLMRSAGGIEYEEAAKDVVVREVARGAHPVRLAATALAHEGGYASREGRGRSGLPALLVRGARAGAAEAVVIPLALPLVLLALVFSTGSAQAGSAERRAAARPPNILFVIADQWRAQAFGYAGNPDIKTPNLDRLQREGVQLRQRRLRHAGLLAHARVAS